MYLPPLRSIEHDQTSINGEVEIDPSAVIAPGVIIMAAPGSRVIVGADAAIGMGVVINAIGGTVEIEAGAALGAGVLIVGQAQIGREACVGTATTIFNASVPPTTVVAAGSVIGDRSRQISIEQVEVEIAVTSKDQPQSNSAASAPTTSTNNGSTTASLSNSFPSEKPQVPEKSDNNAPIGKIYVNQLLLSLFPHRKQQINPGKGDR